MSIIYNIMQLLFEEDTFISKLLASRMSVASSERPWGSPLPHVKCKTSSKATTRDPCFRGSVVREWKPSPWSQAALNQSLETLSKWTVPAPLFGMRVKITTSWVCHGNEMKATNPVTTTWYMLCKWWFSFSVNKDDVLTVHTQTCMTLPLSANMPSFSRHVEQTNLSDAFKIEAQLN